MEQDKSEFIGIKIEPDLKKDLNKLARKQKVSLSRFIRNILKDYLWKGLKK